jgi:predicted DCC family thiol-disulfide oxidoreductase YuxK
MNNVFILFDESCELCKRCRHWIEGQRQIIPVTFIPAGSNEAKRFFPKLDHERTLTELTLITDSGAVYQGTKAYLMCLWILRDYRKWSRSLASPEMMPVAKKFLSMISENRKSLNKLLYRPVSGSWDPGVSKQTIK